MPHSFSQLSMPPPNDPQPGYGGPPPGYGVPRRRNNSAVKIVSLYWPASSAAVFS